MIPVQKSPLLWTTRLADAPVLVGIGMSSVTVVTFAFLTECSPQSSSSAMALEGMMRNPAAAIASVVTPSLVAKMGYGWYFTSYALLDLLVFGGVASCE